VRNVYDGVGRAVAPDNDGLRLLIRYLHILHDAEPLTTPEARALVTRHVQDLLALMLGATGEAREIAQRRGFRAARFKAIQAHIERNLDRSDLSPDTVAPYFRISSRTLQRVFETEGASFSEYVLERRLARVHAVLGDLRNAVRGIGEVALACGFGNLSYF